jgi:hypothetical protein
MNSVKYIGMDVHKEAISVAVLNSSGKLVMECTIEAKAITILEFLKRLRGSLYRSDPGSSDHRVLADTAPVPYQATALDVHRARNRDLQQCQASLCQWRAEAR